MSPHHLSRRTGLVKWSACLAVMAGLSGSTLAAEGDLSPTRPAAVPTNAAPTRVAVLPFSTTPDAEKSGMGTALSQNLINELSTTGAKAEYVNAADPANRVAAARQAGAKYAILGSVQSVGSTLRLSGQLYDVENDKIVAPLQATGPTSEFFNVQDQFIQQAKQSLAAGAAPTDASQPVAMPLGNRSPIAASMPPVTGSHWGPVAAEAPAATPTIIYANTPPPIAPPPPMYGGYRNDFGYGGGGYYDGGYTHFYPDGVVPQLRLGTTRVERLGQIGHSIIPPSGIRNAGNTPTFMTGSNAPIPAYKRPIQQYKNPMSRYAAPVGQPQRAAPPSLRPGAAAPK